MAVFGVPFPSVLAPLSRSTLEQRHGAAAARISANVELRGKRLKGRLIGRPIAAKPAATKPTATSPGAAQEIVAEEVAPLPVFDLDNPQVAVKTCFALKVVVHLGFTHEPFAQQRNPAPVKIRPA